MTVRPLPLIKRLFEGDASERALLIQKEIAEAYEGYLAEPTKRLRKATLAGVYFKAMAYILKKRARTDPRHLAHA
jgi:hypothetical protein